MSETKKGNYLVQAWLVLGLAVSFGAALAGVHIALNPGIEANQRDETYRQIENLVPGADKDRVDEGVFPVDMGGGVTAERKYYRAHDADDQTLGYMLRASGMGYVDKIEVLIGVDEDVKVINGIYVLSQVETPGLGNKIDSDGFTDQFKHLSVGTDIEAKKGQPDKNSNNIRAITSATISSVSVCSIVNEAVREFRDYQDGVVPKKLAIDSIPDMLGGVTSEQIEEIVIGSDVVFKVYDDDGNVRAWVAAGRRRGRWNRIDMLVALDPTAKTITHMHVIAQAEKWWSRVEKVGYVKSFVGQKARRVVMTRSTKPEAQQVQVVTKATTTSTAICRIVNSAVKRLKQAAAADNGAAAEKEQ